MFDPYRGPAPEVTAAVLLGEPTEEDLDRLTALSLAAVPRAGSAAVARGWAGRRLRTVSVTLARRLGVRPPGVSAPGLTDG